MEKYHVCIRLCSKHDSKYSHVSFKRSYVHRSATSSICFCKIHRITTFFVFLFGCSCRLVLGWLQKLLNSRGTSNTQTQVQTLWPTYCSWAKDHKYYLKVTLDEKIILKLEFARFAGWRTEKKLQKSLVLFWNMSLYSCSLQTDVQAVL